MENPQFLNDGPKLDWSVAHGWAAPVEGGATEGAELARETQPEVYSGAAAAGLMEAGTLAEAKLYGVPVVVQFPLQNEAL